MNIDFDNYKRRSKQRFIERRCIEKIVRQGGCCWICGYSDDPRIIEWHHVAGRHNSSITISVCPICHRILSLKQMSWDPNWTNPNNPDEVKHAFHLQGMSDVFALYSQLCHDWSNKIIRGD